MTEKSVAIVTGASGGIGKALSEYFASQGYFVVLLAQNEHALAELATSIQSEGGVADYMYLDVSSSSQVAACINKIMTRYQRIDVLFNNAGILKHGTSELSSEEVDRLLKINLNGAIYVAQAVAQHMKKQGHGYIFNLSSIGGKVATSFGGVYSASKFGLVGFGDALAQEMAAYNVKVTNICPSMVATEMTQGRKFEPEQMLQSSDIVKTIDYLLSLSPNALPREIVIDCLPVVKMLAQEVKKIFGLV